MVDPPTLKVGGMKLVRVTRSQLADLMLQDIGAARSSDRVMPRVVSSANGSVIAAYHRDAGFRAVMDAIDFVDADGMPLVFASRVFCKQPLPERASTTDFILDACEVAARHGLRFYFLGARRGVAARAAEHLRSRFPGLEIVGVHHGYFSEAALDAICSDILAKRTDVLWIGMGSPKQEELAVALKSKLCGLGWIRTCGGLFDHYGGGVSRAPDWMQMLGLEWLYRAAREPLRLGWRYLVTSPVAVYHLLTKTSD